MLELVLVLDAHTKALSFSLTHTHVHTHKHTHTGVHVDVQGRRGAHVPIISKKVWWYVSFPTSSRSLCFPPACISPCHTHTLVRPQTLSRARRAEAGAYADALLGVDGALERGEARGGVCLPQEYLSPANSTLSGM